MKMKKRLLSILLSLVMVFGHLPGMSVMAIADGQHHIYNEISAIIPGLSITKDGTTVTGASSGDTITLAISGQPVTGKIGDLWKETDRTIDSRNIMVDGLQAYKADGTTITTDSTGSQTWSFTMPNEDVYIAFPLLTANDAISINAGEAAFRTGFATLNSYCFYTHITDSSDGDSFGYLAYKNSNGEYNYTSNDDGGNGYNFKIPGDSGVTIKQSTFYHLGFAEYSASRSGTFTIPAISSSMDIPFGSQEVNPQTVTAEDIEMSFGEICTIAATTNGNGTLSYKVESGDEVIDVNNLTGVITTKKAGTATVKITASGTTTYAVGSKVINVTVNKARAIVATVNENSRTYDGTEKPLVTVDNSTLVGGTMQYALGTDSTTEPTSGWNEGIPVGTDAGTYYVWYKAVGDNDHSDSDAKVISVTIQKKGEAHNHTIKLVDAKDPTCTENGYKAHYECTECGKWFEDASGSVEITDKTSFIIDATGHKWDDGVVTKEATYDETGIKTFTCENDPSHTKEEVIPMKEYRESDTDNSDGSSGGGSGKNSGSVSKQSIDVHGNTISSNHQAESGLPASDVGGNWGNNAEIWTYTKSDGTVAKAEWMNLDYNGLRYWYYFDSNGIMQTNWFDYNNERFYLMPEKDGWRGRMATGWKNIENKWYYFETVPGSSQGRLYRSTVTPDGHTVGADGAWNGVGATPVGQK